YRLRTDVAQLQNLRDQIFAQHALKRSVLLTGKIHQPGAIAVTAFTFPGQRIPPTDIARAGIPAAVRNRYSLSDDGLQRSIQLAALMNSVCIGACLDKSAV